MSTRKIFHRSSVKVILMLSFKGETRALMGEGGVYSHIHVLQDEFLLKSALHITTDFKRNSSKETIKKI